MRTRGSQRAGFDEERVQYRVLFRAFFRQTVRERALPETVDLRLAVCLAAVLASPPAFFAVRLWTFYWSGMSDAELALRSVPHKLYFVGYSMAVSGLLTVLVWDTICFPITAPRRCSAGCPSAGFAGLLGPAVDGEADLRCRARAGVAFTPSR